MGFSWRFFFFLGIVCLLSATGGRAQSAHRQLRAGEAAYDQKNYAKAEQAYRSAGAAGRYNAANAAYQQGNMEEATRLYQGIADASRPDALFNAGNALLSQGRYKEAITAYSASLRLQPNREDAKKNLQIARKKDQEKPPVPPPPPPPPPPPQQQRLKYLDQARSTRVKESVPAPMSREAALLLLEKTVSADAERNARRYRESTVRVKPASAKKNW